MFDTLDPHAIIATITKLEARIEARFAGAGLAAVARDLASLGAEAAGEAQTLSAPNWWVRGLVGVLFAAGLIGFGLIARLTDFHADTNNLFALIQSIDALMNVGLIVGAAILSLVTIEARLKRNRILGALHPFRAIVHVIDMHQLTKDPAMAGPKALATAASPTRGFTPFELSRYLDYCSELLSLTAKVAALYALASRDAVVATAVNEIEQLTSNLSHKIWQKIMIIHADQGRAGAADGE